MATTGVRKQPTGIENLDEILDGGFPQNFNIILNGTPGTGKTLLAQQWLYEGYAQYREKGLYLGFTESTEKAIANITGMSFYDKKVTGPKGINFLDFRIILKQLALASNKSLAVDELNQLVDVIRHLADNMGAKRIVIDSITAILQLIESQAAKRDFLFQLSTSLSQINATILLIAEAEMAHKEFGVESFMADGIINFSNTLGQQRMVRHMNILKMRSSAFRSGSVMFDITSDGLMIYPKIPSYTTTAKTSFNKRLSTGVAPLDKLIGGGVPQGHVILVGGNTGSGKSTFGLHFVAAGIENDENCCFVALEESITQIKKTALQHGFPFEKWEKAGKLHFVTGELIDIYPDQLLYEIVKTLERTKAKRIIIDSISTMENGSFDRTRVREFLLQLMAYVKREGVTCYMTYLTTELFGAADGQLMSGTASTELGLSSMVDGIFLLRYVERKQTVRKLLNILKMRGSQHDKNIIEFNVGKKGIEIGEQFED